MGRHQIVERQLRVEDQLDGRSGCGPRDSQMIEIPYRFLATRINHEDRGRQQLGWRQGLNALPSGSLGELSKSIQLGALR